VHHTLFAIIHFVCIGSCTDNLLADRWANVNPDCVGSIVLCLKTQVYMPGDVIFFKHSVGREMFFVSKGTVEVLDDSDCVFQTQSVGDIFGEIR
jgi:signal-transduction protein with cAMP-binding, CBS, and nucleotidyltransferase domain